MTEHFKCDLIDRQLYMDNEIYKWLFSSTSYARKKVINLKAVE